MILSLIYDSFAGFLFRAAGIIIKETDFRPGSQVTARSGRDSIVSSFLINSIIRFTVRLPSFLITYA
ncbi:MAG TPA: hypothetical protein VFF56_05185 [Bacillota bacterium]|nr:hypothetical protein [Bacillota bacterium]